MQSETHTRCIVAKPKKSSAKKVPTANPLWGGHFAHGPAEAFAAINPSIAIDQRLYAQDIEGSLAHCRMLEAQKIISKKDSAAIQRGLAQVLTEIQSGAFAFTAALEDIHMNIESRLKEIIGDAAGRLHTARSRNDQVATDTRLFARHALQQVDVSLQQLQAALLAQAASHTDTILPGYTHLQPAQPISFAHHLLAYVEMFGRDRSRSKDAQARLNECPLGAAALAGTTYPIDRAMTAHELGFRGPMRNSLDAVGSRDYIIEIAAVCSIIATHLSRLAEEMIFWATPQIGFVKFSDAFTSGSSIMPQKRNPDAAELVRGKTGAIVGSLMAIITTVKALPLAYNKDLQEDKAPLFAALDQTLLCISAITGMVADMKPQVGAMRAACAQGFLNATDLADWLVQEAGVAFREAHHITGRLVKRAEEKGVALDALSLAEMKKVDARITQDVFAAINLDACVARRTSFGGTAPSRVKKAIAAASKEYL